MGTPKTRIKIIIISIKNYLLTVELTCRQAEVGGTGLIRVHLKVGRAKINHRAFSSILLIIGSCHTSAGSATGCNVVELVSKSYPQSAIEPIQMYEYSFLKTFLIN